MKKETVLLLSHSNDYFTIDRVLAAVSASGYRAFRLNTDEFPRKLQLSLHLTGKNQHITLVSPENNATLESQEVASVWLRKIWVPFIDEDMDPILRKGCISESWETLNIFLAELHAAQWLDPLLRVKLAENKLLQLQQANAAGLRTPETLISNHPQEVRAFFQHLRGQMIAKLLTPLSISMAGNTPAVRTHRVLPQFLEDLDSLQYSPMVFQENIEKKLELRIIYVDGQTFTGAVNPEETRGGQTDWRASAPGTLKWQDFQVPEPIRQKIETLMHALGLRFGALDVILEPGGEYVFLEVNPTGEWGMLERDLDLPISQAIADVLVKGIGK